VSQPVPYYNAVKKMASLPGRGDSGKYDHLLPTHMAYERKNCGGRKNLTICQNHQEERRCCPPNARAEPANAPASNS